MRKIVLILFLASATISAAQTPPAAEPVKLSREDELERENIRLIAIVTELQKQVADLRAQVQATQVQTRASTFLEKMRKAHPELEMDPNTLEFKPKAEPPKVKP